MKKLLRILLSVFVLIFMLAGFQPSLVSAHHSWGTYHWAHSSLPVSVRLADNVSSQWKPFLYGAAYYWNRSSVLDIPVTSGSSTPSTCKMKSGTVQVCNYSYGSTGWMGLAQLTVTGDRITAATVKLNDTYFNTSRYNNSAWKNLVMCQEVGHTFGLTHQDENFSNTPLGTCMDYSSNPNPNQWPNYHDYQQLVTIYTRMDASVASDTSLAADDVTLSGLGDLNNKNDWGTLVKGSEPGAASDMSLASETGRVAMYERDLGAGKKLQTTVMWVK